MPVFPVSLLWLLLLAFPAAARAFPECSYYKLSPGDFLAALDTFAKDVQAHIQRNPTLLDELAQGGNITQSLYEAGVIEQVPGCLPSADAPNVEVVGGDPLKIVETIKPDASGFSLIVRGLPRPLCQVVREHSGGERLMWVRPEPPGRTPGRVGDCIGNPVTFGLTLGRHLPVPNTAYVYRRIASTAEVSLCPMDPGEQLANMNNGADAPCVAVQAGRARPGQVLQCKHLVEQIRSELTRQQNTLSQHDIESYSIEQRLALIRPLFVSYALPQNQALFNDRQRQLLRIYVAGPQGNIDANYWESEQKTYHRIGQAVQQMACDNNWAPLLKKPNSWVELSTDRKKKILNDVYLAFNSVKPIQLNQFKILNASVGGTIDVAVEVFEDVSLKPVLERLRFTKYNGLYVSDANNPFGDQFRDSIFITPLAYQLPFAVSLQNPLEVLLEELMHAHQHEVQDQYMNSALPLASHACVQAAMFFYNFISPATDPDADLVSETIEEWRRTQYKSQPLEYHAKAFAKLVTRQILDEAGAQCQQPVPAP